MNREPTNKKGLNGGGVEGEVGGGDFKDLFVLAKLGRWKVVVTCVYG